MTDLSLKVPTALGSALTAGTFFGPLNRDSTGVHLAMPEAHLSLPLLPASSLDGCVGCLVDELDHSCGYVDHINPFDQSSRHRVWR